MSLEAIEDWDYGVPSFVGVYRIRTAFGGPWFRVWNGSDWLAGNNTIQGAAQVTAACQAPDRMSDGWQLTS